MKKKTIQTKKNEVHSDIAPNTIKAIRESLHSDPSQYRKNLKKIHEIEWTWRNGATTTIITYKDRSHDKRINKSAPPTKACHDIAHFIAAFHKDLEWDYLQTTNHLCEYNAVAIESIMNSCCHSIRCQTVIDQEAASSAIIEHLKWFHDDYYQIPSKHPSKANHHATINNLVDRLDTNTLNRYFDIFYELWCIEEENRGPNFQAKVIVTADKQESSMAARSIMEQLVNKVRLLIKQADQGLAEPDQTP
jgi:hypothetical protein